MKKAVRLGLLIFGASSCYALAAVLESGTLSSGSAMNSPRAVHTLSPLPDGKALIVGGCIRAGCDGSLTSSSEIYDPIQKTYRTGPTLKVARAGHVAISLADGRIVILGGWSGADATAVVEVYSPKTQTFSVLGNLLEGRDGFTATLLKDEKILVVGGYNGPIRRLDSAELFDPQTGISARVGGMSSPRMAHTATRLEDGRVLVVGGSRARGNILSSAEIYDPATQSFNPTGSLKIPRHKQAANLLKDGRVLVMGGADARDFEGKLNSTEIFDLQNSRFEAGPPMQNERFKFPTSVVSLPNNDLLITGSGTQAEIYRTSKNQFETVKTPLGQNLFYTAAALLKNGEVFVTGGYSDRLQIQNHTWIYRP
jgi:WD40 repeat protein